MAKMPLGQPEPPLRPNGFRLLVGGFVVMVALSLGKSLIVPLALAALVAFILTPVVVYLQNLGVGRILSVLLVTMTAVVMTLGATFVVVNQLYDLAVELPSHRVEIEAKLSELEGLSGDRGIGRVFNMLDDLIGPKDHKPLSPLLQLPEPTVVVATEREDAFGFGDLLVPVAGGLAQGGLILLLVIFMLMRREDVRNRIIRLMGHSRLTGATRATVDAASRVSRLLLSQLLVNLSFGLILGLGFFVMGVPYAPLWGFTAALLRFVPYVGVIIAIVAPLLFTFATSPGWTQSVGVLGYTLVVVMLVANVIEPILFSRRTGVSPLALIIAAAFWTFLWGPVGLIVSTPLTICLVVLGSYSPQFAFLAILLGDEPALAPDVNFYQRLLASDRREASAVAVAHAHEHGAADAFDTVMLPTLRAVRRDISKAGLSVTDANWIFEAVEETIAEIPIGPPESPESPGALDAETKPLVLGYPAHHRSETVGLAMMRQMLTHVALIDVISQRVLASTLETRVAEENPAMLLFAIVPPGGVTQVTYLCRSFRRRFPDLPIVVAYLRRPKNYDKLLVKLREAGASYLTTSIAQTESRIKAILKQEATRPSVTNKV